MDPCTYYSSIIAAGEIRLKRLRRQAALVAVFRLIVFVSTVAACFILEQTFLIAIVAICGLVLFLWLAKCSGKTENEMLIEEAKIERSKANIDRLDLKLENLPGGEEYIDAQHDFAFDIDLFGKNSLFSLLDSTSTSIGSRKLAEWLLRPQKVYGEIELRQQAVKELSDNNSFRLAISSIGKLAEDETSGNESFNVAAIPDFSVNRVWKLAYLATPFAYIVLFALMAFGLIPGVFIFYFFLLVLAASGLQAKRVGRLHKWLTQSVKRMASCSDLLKTIENGSFESSVLRNLQMKVKSGNTSASCQALRLMRIINNLDQRYNVFGYAIMNGFFLWDMRQIDNASRWMAENAAKVAEWDDAIAEFDAFCALATFSFNNPGYIFPSLDKSGDIIIEAENAGHPLISAEKCVCNNIGRLSLQSFFVVTGANMAGKSTYLRTVAVNYLLALTGMPVFARRMTFSPATLFTGLRTSDSLSDGASYFFSELSRLRQIVQRAGNGEKMLVILDEILRGTNSTDKQKGSLGLVRKLINLPVAGIIATHDLALGSLAESYPDKIKNFRFEAEISGSKLLFSYRIQPGIAQNTNAFYLMQTMGII